MNVVKTLFVLALIAVSLAADGPKPGEEREDFLKRIVGECSKEIGINLEKASQLLLGDLSINSCDAKCFVSCFFKKEGFIDENGEPQREFIVDFIDGTVPFSRDQLTQVVTACTNFESKDHCENAYHLLACFTNAAAEAAKSGKSDEL